jgi:hypothetical protein
MLDEPIDDIIREAADGYQPPFDEKAWAAMSQKLNVHLPQKNRKGRYFLLLLLLVVGGATAYWLLQPGRDKDNRAAEAVTQANGVEPGNTNTDERATALMPTPPNPSEPLTNKAVTDDVQPSNSPLAASLDKPFIKEKTSNSSLGPVTAVKKHYRKGIHRTTIAPAVAEDGVAEANEMPKNEILTVTPVGTANATESNEVMDATVNQAESTTQPEKPTYIVTSDTFRHLPLLTGAKRSSDTTAAAKTALSKAKDKKGLGSHLVLLLSAGADMSYVRLSNQGKTTLLYGAGLGYTIGKRWMVRAGVYSVEKIYAASKTDYSLPPQMANNPYLYQIDARCRVLEIPVGVTYSFAGQKNHRWFAGAGIASMLMKTEQYDYQYKSATGINYTRSYGVRNENKHYLAILSLSAGYQYQVGKRFSLLAEPYVQLPLNGVGLGKVKLQSTGLLLTAAFRPFGKR